MTAFIRLARNVVFGKFIQRKRQYFYGGLVSSMWVMRLLKISVRQHHLMAILSERHNMYDGANDVDDEVKQNLRDQMNPVETTARVEVATTGSFYKLKPELVVHSGFMATEEIRAESSVKAGPEVGTVLGLSKRQVELSHNIDNEPPGQGEARQKRLLTINENIAAIERFLPRMEEVLSYLSDMPTEDESLYEAKKLSIQRINSFISEVNERLTSLQAELALKPVTG